MIDLRSWSRHRRLIDRYVVIAGCCGGVLFFVPSVGVVQALLATAILIAGTAWSRAEVSHTARGGWRWRAAARAIPLGLATSASWVPVGALLGLDDYVRMQPIAIGVMLVATIVVFGLDMVLRFNRVTLCRYLLLVLVQCAGVGFYGRAVSPNSPATLGYLWNSSGSVSPDGTREIELRTEGYLRLSGHRSFGPNATVIYALDRETGCSTRLSAVPKPYAGLRFHWSPRGVQWTWYAPSDETVGSRRGLKAAMVYLEQRRTTSPHRW